MSGKPAILFVLSCAYVFYVMAGYPLLLKILSRLRRKPIRKGEFLPTVAMVIPVRNAEAYIDRKLESVLALDYPRELMDVLVISDGSSDETDSIVRGYAPWNVRLLHVPAGGKAAALNTGILTTRSQIVLLSDVWQIVDRSSLREMMKCFADPAVGMVSGEVVMDARTGDAEERNLSMFASIESWFGERLSDLDSLLSASGSFYAIRRPLMPKIPSDMLLDDLYVAMAAFFRGYRVVGEPEATAFDAARPVETEFGDKIKAEAGEYQIMKQYSGLLDGRNRMRFHYLSFKLARLLLPFALITMAVTSFQLHPRRLMIGVLVAQGLVYGLAIVHPWVSSTFFLKRLSAAAHTFVTTMIAALCGAVAVVVPVRKLWKDAGLD